MSRSALTALAALTLLVTIWLVIITARPGSLVWAALGAGVAAYVTMLLAVAAARKEDRVRR